MLPGLFEAAWPGFRRIYLLLKNSFIELKKKLFIHVHPSSVVEPNQKLSTKNRKNSLTSAMEL